MDADSELAVALSLWSDAVDRYDGSAADTVASRLIPLLLKVQAVNEQSAVCWKRWKYWVRQFSGVQEVARAPIPESAS